MEEKMINGKKIMFFELLVLTMFFMASCQNPASEPTAPAPLDSTNGSIKGKVTYSGGQSNSGIIVSLEKSDGLVAESVQQSVQRARAIARSIAYSTQTAQDGSYRFTEIAPGNYTIYASSQNSAEKAVKTNVVVLANQSVTASDLNLTATGSLSGTIKLDGSTTGNWGFFVSIAGTSYMATTADSGSWKINEIPARTDPYQIIVIKGSYTVLWDADGSADAAAIITSGEDRAMGSMTLTSAAIRDGLMSLVWKGSLVEAPANPLLNWAYYNITDKTSYIYDGDRWETLAVSGQNGVDGTDGVDGVNGTDGTDGVNGTDGANGVGIVWRGALTEAPASPQLNWAYYNSIEGKSYIYDGYEWQILSQDGTDGVDGTDGINGVDGASFFWKGAFAAHPANPQLNWAYYNSADGKAYIYSGGAWQILAENATIGGFSPTTATMLTSGAWTYNARIATAGEVDWYKFTATGTQTYFLKWDDSDYGSSGNYTANIYVSAYKADGSTPLNDINGINTAYSSPKTFTGYTGPVYIKVTGGTGTYSIVCEEN
jgi:hypothetical protein